MKLLIPFLIVLSSIFAQGEDQEAVKTHNVFNFGGSVHVRRTTSELTNVIPKAHLEYVISRTYEKEYSNNLEHQLKNLSTDVLFVPAWNTSVFSCENGKLSSILYKQVLGNHPESPKGPTFQFHLKDGKFKLQGYKCEATGDWEDGIVKTMSGKCSHLEIGKNVFKYGTPFYTFPQVANACCAKSGCSESVYKELVKFVNGVSERAPEKARPKVNIK